MSPSNAPSQPVELRPHLLVFLRDKTLATITHIVDGPAPYELLGQTKARDGRPPEPMLWRGDGHYEPAQGTHSLDIVGIELVEERTADGRAVFGPFTGLKFKGKGGTK